MSSLTNILRFNLAAFAILAFVPQSLWAQIIFEDGGTSVVDSVLNEHIIVRDSAMGMPTTVLIQLGADIPSFDPNGEDTSIFVEDTSMVEMSDGMTDGGFNLFDDAVGVFTGGVVGDEVQLFGNAIITIGNPDGMAMVLDIEDDLELADNSMGDFYEGRVFDDVETTGSAVLNIYDGEFDEDIEAFDSSTINIFGGVFNTGFSDLTDIEGGEIAVEDDDIINSAFINIHGGTFMGAPNLDGDFVPDFCAEGNGTMTIFGSDFAIDGVPVPFGDITVATGQLTGTLEDGSPLDNDFEIDDNARIILAEATLLLGDVNCDGEINILDVAPFVQAITNGPFSAKADINQDGVNDLLDVAPFVALITGG